MSKNMLVLCCNYLSFIQLDFFLFAFACSFKWEVFTFPVHFYFVFLSLFFCAHPFLYRDYGVAMFKDNYLPVTLHFSSLTVTVICYR